jgi:hypothetical protein
MALAVPFRPREDQGDPDSGGAVGMGGQLVPHRGAVLRGEAASLTTTAAAASTASVAFSGDVITWDSLPARTHRAARRASPVVAQAVERDLRYRVDNGRAVEHATGWRVHEDAVVLADVARPVAPAPSGGTCPVGPWEHRGVRIWAASGPARHRRGVVDVADELRSGLGSSRAPVASEQARAAEAWGYLPLVVRADAERLVPTPTTWLGELVQERSADGFPTKQDIRSLRMSPARAIVLLATRVLAPIPGAGLAFHTAQMARVPWVVEQVGLDLGEPAVRTQLRRA